MTHSHLCDIIFRFSFNFSLPHQIPLILGWSATPLPAKSQLLYSRWRARVVDLISKEERKLKPESLCDEL